MQICCRIPVQECRSVTCGDLIRTTWPRGADGAKQGPLYARPQERSRDKARRRRSNRPGNSQAKGPRAEGRSGKQRVTSRSPKE